MRRPAAEATKPTKVAAATRFHESLLELIPTVLSTPSSFLDLKTASCSAQTIATDMLMKTRAETSQMFASLSPTTLLKKAAAASGEAWRWRPAKLLMGRLAGR